MTSPNETEGSATLGDIIDAVRSGQRPSYDALLYAICALESLSNFDRQALMRLADAEREGRKPLLSNSALFQWDESFRRLKTALEKPPREWIGWNNDPANPEFRERRRSALKLFKREDPAHG